MIAKHLAEGWVFFTINNLHTYDNQFEQAEELLRRELLGLPTRLVLNARRDQSLFGHQTRKDFELVDCDPVEVSWSSILRFSDTNALYFYLWGNLLTVSRISAKNFYSLS